MLLCGLLVFSESCRYRRMPDKKAKSEFSLQYLFPHFMYMTVDHVNLRYINAAATPLRHFSFFIHGSPGNY